MAVQCRTSKEAARVLGISFRTVETHRTNIYDKLGVRSAVELATRLATEQPVAR